MSTKSFQSFDGKIRSLKQHLQLLDLSLTKTNQACTKQKNNGKTIAETLSSIELHPQLNIPNTIVDVRRTFITSRKKVNEQAIIELYGCFSDYISSIIREIENSDPKRILSLIPKSSETSLKYTEIFNLGGYDKILDEIANRVYRSLENERSTTKLLKKFINIAKLDVPNILQEDALTYLEVRHLIIHANSRADVKFNKLNQRNLVNVNPTNQMLTINYEMSSAAILKVYELCKRIDDEIINKSLLR